MRGPGRAKVENGRAPARIKQAVLAAGAVLGLIGATSGQATAATYYPLNTAGYDVSYPNCNVQPTGSFAIVGLGGGRPFTLNRCASSEFNSAPATDRALYFNTGYAGAYTKSITGLCQQEVGGAGVFGTLSGHSLRQAQQAWEIGCSEADFAQTNEPGQPAMWWADVETGNSWSTNTALNQFAIDGISYRMSQLGGGGFYSDPSMWGQITGDANWAPTPAPSGSWVAGASACTITFGGVSTWVIQGGAPNGYDVDSGCQ